MKIIKKDLKKQEITLKIENLDDIWILNQIIEEEDLLKGKTERKIKIGNSDDRNVKVIRKQVFLSIKIEKINISSDSKILKVLGIICDGPEEVPRGEHHSFNLEINSVFTITKNQWLKYQIKKLEDATKSIPVKILIVVFDREEVYFAKLKGQGYEILGKIQGDVQKKEEKHISKNDFYKQITEKIQEYNKIDNLNNIILASPSFWKENLIKILPEELKKKTVLATISQVSERSFSEVLKRDELKKILEKNQGTQEVKLLDKLLQHISKNTACYGLKDTKEKIEIGAVSELMISDSYLQNTKEKGFYKEVEKLMIACEQMDGKTHIISSEEAKKSLDSLSGIAGILRWNN